MATLPFISNTLSSSSSSSCTQHFTHNHKPLLSSPTLSFLSKNSSRKLILELGSHQKAKSRSFSVVTRAGPSSTNYIFAFVFPLSLLAVTIFSSMKVADKLDQKFIEELAVNEAILEAEDGDGDNNPFEGKPAVPRTRVGQKEKSRFLLSSFLFEF